MLGCFNSLYLRFLVVCGSWGRVVGEDFMGKEGLFCFIGV